MSVDRPATCARTGQRCTPPAPGDATVGLLLLVLPLLALVVWVKDEESELTKGWLLAFVVVYAVGVTIALRGFTSDASPLRMNRRFVPMRYLVLAVVWAVGLPWGVAMLLAPGTAAAQEAAARGEIHGTPTPTATASDGSLLPVEPPSNLDLWVASGGTVMYGQIVVMLAFAALIVLVVLFVRARRAQLAEFPRLPRDSRADGTDTSARAGRTASTPAGGQAPDLDRRGSDA
ncbi:hypothetical protein [Sanguibacter massiliensis]|uniref:hypothetical protein n=1 Tax=Sanguibacter massiliensis TaxID=1973217 RepID=UPI000C865120|nr:hypothetical protein [Sanguibacter massiliensis]